LGRRVPWNDSQHRLRSAMAFVSLDRPAAANPDTGFDVFLSHRHEDHAAVEILARRLRDEAHLRPWLDTADVPGGTPWQEAIENALESSQTCAVVIGRGGLSAWQNEEVRVALAARVNRPGFRVVPVLLPGTTEGDLPPFLARLQWIDFGGPQGVEEAEAFQDLVDGIRGVSLDADAPMGFLHRLRPERAAPAALDSNDVRNRQELLDDVSGEVRDRLIQASPPAAVISLHKTAHPREVTRPWDAESKLGAPSPTALALGTELFDVFDRAEIGGELLILGAPGAGKTTTLLQLARALGQRAERDPVQPMPVLLNLSSWTDETVPIASWLVAELRVKYGVRKEVGKRWIKERRLIPLLDGLDEVAPHLLESCIHAINRFHRTCRPAHLVVCCRVAEYQNCDARLRLNGAIHLEPLTTEQIQHYLEDRGCPGLWNDIKAAPELLEIATSPLLLSMMTTLTEEAAATGRTRWSPSPEGREHLFASYVDRMLSRRVRDGAYPKPTTMHWLGWLAARLRASGQPEFLIERLQPSWLEARAERFGYGVAVGVITGVIVTLTLLLWDAALTLLPTSRIASGTQQIIEQGLQDVFGLSAETSRRWRLLDWAIPTLFGVIAGTVIALRPTIIPVETLRWSGHRAWAGAVLGGRRWSIAAFKLAAYLGLVVYLIVAVRWALSIPIRANVRPDLTWWFEAGKVSGIVAGGLTGVGILWLAWKSLRPLDTLGDWPTIRSGEVRV